MRIVAGWLLLMWASVLCVRRCAGVRCARAVRVCVLESRVLLRVLRARRRVLCAVLCCAPVCAAGRRSFGWQGCAVGCGVLRVVARPQLEHIRASLTTRKHTRQPRSSLTCSADRMLAPWAADDPVGRAARPPYTIRQARDHPQHAAAHRAALPAKPAPPSCTNRAQNRAQRTAHTGGARAAHTDARATAARTRTQHARVARQRSAAHRAHLPTSAAASLPQSSSHTRAHTLPPTGARIGRRRELPKLTCVAACAACS